MSLPPDNDPIGSIAPDNSFTNLLLSPGSGLETPNEFSSCKVRIVNKVENLSLDQSQLGFKLNASGGSDDSDAVEWTIGLYSSPIAFILDKCLQTMKLNEKSEFTFEWNPSETDSTHHHSHSNSSPSVVSLDLKFSLHLVSFQRSKELYLLNNSEKLERATQLKAMAGKLYSQQQVEASFKLYHRALAYCLSIELPQTHVTHCQHPHLQLPSVKEDDEEFSEEFSQKLINIKSVLYANMAACQLKRNSFEYVIQNCSKSLQFDASNVKALFRRAIAVTHQGDFELARDDLLRAIQLEPENKALRDQLTFVDSKSKQLDDQFAKAMSKLNTSPSSS